MRATAIVPLKRRTAAKQRLGTGMDDERRRALVLAMASDVLTAISKSRSIERTIVVTGDPDAAQVALQTGAEVIDDPDDAGHNEAALTGIARAKELGAECVALLPGDCPLLDPRELDRLLTGVPPTYVGIVPDRHGTGTNALILTPPDAITPAFGEGSCERHVGLAREAGIPFGVENFESLALDLDTPVDVIALTRALHSGKSSASGTAKVLGI